MTNVVYFGSPDFSANTLESIIIDLKSTISVVAVVTNPDKKVGRKQLMTPSPVAQVALNHHLPAFKPETLDGANLAHLKLLKPDIFLTVAYGKVIPESWLTTPKIKSLNLHFSLLPKYRGALCIQEALKNGDSQTGVTLMEMSTGLDSGPVISQSSINIEINDNIADLQTKLTQVGVDLLVQSLPKYIAGKLDQSEISATKQDENLASYTPSLKTVTRQSAFVAWDQISVALNSKNSLTTHNLIRSLNPEPGAWTTVNGQELKIIATHMDNTNSAMTIKTVQMPGKSPITWAEYLSGHPL